MTDWTEAGDASTDWTEADPTYPKIGGTPGTVGDVWHALWFPGHDMTFWTRAGNKETTWTENN